MRAQLMKLSGAAALLATAITSAGADFQAVFKNQVTTQTAPETQAVQPAQAEPPPPQAATRNRDVTRAVRSRPNAQAAGAIATDRAVTRPAAPPAAAETSVNATAEIARGVELYKRGEILQAAQIFEARARAEPTPDRQSTTLARLGAQWQREVNKVAPSQRTAVRNAAISAYRQTLRIDPNSGIALNNLAQMLKTEPAGSAEADALLARAISLNDSRKGVYLLNRAALRRDANDLEAATDLARQAAADDKGNVQAHSLVMDLLEKRRDAGALLDYIRDLESQGLVVRALDSAAQGMKQLPSARASLLISVARTLGSESYTANPAEFEKTDAGVAIAAFQADPAIGAGVTELFGVLRSPVPVTALTWWRAGFDGSTDPDERSPAGAMQGLTLRCGEIYQVAGEPRAEGYYRMSVVLSGRMATDPRALLRLAELLYEQNRIDDLNRILQENEQGLMEAKRRTIAASDYLHTYQLRLALGMMYGYTQRWVNERQPYAASIWMLQNAIRSARDYNRQAGLPGDRQVKLPPSAVKMLSKGYASTDRIDRSVETRIEAANLYLESGQTRFAQQVLDVEWQSSLPSTVSAELRQKLAEVTARVGS
jgi:tetratricopeptide (TPR) repeat protein